jgi:hypothetical protein
MHLPNTAATTMVVILVMAPSSAVAESSAESQVGPDWLSPTLTGLFALVVAVVGGVLATRAQQALTRAQQQHAELLDQIARHHQGVLDASRRRHEQSLEVLRRLFEYRLDADRLLLERRMCHYEAVLQLLQNFPKYPRPRPLSKENLMAIGCILQDWYFGGAGLYMSTGVREAYFDLQSGLQIVLARIDQTELWSDLGGTSPPSDEDLRQTFERATSWQIPQAIRNLIEVLGAHDRVVTDAANPASSPVLPKAIAQLRHLASGLRTELCCDLNSRRYLPNFTDP